MKESLAARVERAGLEHQTTKFKIGDRFVVPEGHDAGRKGTITQVLLGTGLVDVQLDGALQVYTFPEASLRNIA